jgi:hypothetical protein
MSPSFSPLQRHCLDALGYTRYALAAPAAAAPAIETVVPAVASAPLATGGARDAALLVAILRAARLRIDGIPDPQGWLRARGVESIASLRGDPTAKRTLWTMLRIERRAS